MALHEAKADQQHIRVALSIPDVPVSVDADTQQLGVVFENLINNAVEAMPDGGELRITVTRHDDNAVVSVADTGPGIPDQVVEQLFTPFFTTKAAGTGIGLHPGIATGAEFRVVLPMSESVTGN